MIKVTYYQRKPIIGKHWSLEFIFNSIRKNLSNKIISKIVISKFYSQGLLNRILNIFYVLFYQYGDINNITGDIHYVTYFLKKKKTILTILDCGLMFSKNRYKRFFFKLFWLTLPSKRVSCITTISESVKKDLLKFIPNFNPNKIFVIPVPISNDFHFSNKIFNKLDPILLQIGTAHNKNIYRLIESIKDISCQLVIVGEIDDIIFDKLNLYKIKYFNYTNISQTKLISLYTECDILTFVSTYEGFGMPIIEANKIGRVVVTSNCSSMLEIANDSACLVDPLNIESIKSGIQRVIDDDNYRNSLIENGRINGLKYNLETIANSYLLLYNKIKNNEI